MGKIGVARQVMIYTNVIVHDYKTRGIHGERRESYDEVKRARH